MESPMHKLLNHLIEQSGNKIAAVQIQFQLGQPSAGGLEKGPVEGIFKFTTVLEAAADAPASVRLQGNKVVVNQYFQADSVAQVIVQDDSTDESRIWTGEG